MGKIRKAGTFLLSAVTLAALVGCAGAGEPGTDASRATGATTPEATPITASAPEPSAQAASPTASAPALPTEAWKIGPNGECDAGQLEFALESRPMDSGMSQFYWNLQMTNTSDTACTLAGYPQVRLVSSATGESIGASAGRDAGAGPSDGIVDLPPEASAYSLLHLSQAGAYDCAIVAVTELAVTPPHWDTSRTVPTPDEIDGCDDLGIELVSAGPVTATPLE